MLTDNMTNDIKLIINTLLDNIITKDKENLENLLDDKFILTHMSGKEETKNEFIRDLLDETLNYYNAELEIKDIQELNEIIKVRADVTLDAMVYNIKGVWTLNSAFTIHTQKRTIIRWDN